MTTDIPEAGFRRFLIGFMATVAVIIIPIWIWVVEEPLAYLSHDYPIWLAKVKMLHDGEVGSLTILGDSTAVAAMIPSRIGPGVVNDALGGGTPIEAFIIAKKIVSGPSPPKAVIISITPFDFVEPSFFWLFDAEFGFLSFKEADELRQRSRALKDDRIFDTESLGDLNARLKLFLYAIKFPSYYYPALVNSRFDGRYADNLKVYNLVLANRGQGYFGVAHGSTEPDHEVSIKSFVPSRILDDYFDQTLALLQAHHIPAYYLSMPHNAASVQLYSPGLKEAFVQYLNHYTTRYPNFHILGDPLPSYPSEDFGDAWHLNERAAPLWSDYVRQLLNDSHVEGGPFVPNEK